MASVRITEYTDPGCPWAFSAEPFRLALEWTYGDQLEITPRMVVLSQEPNRDEQLLATISNGMAKIAAEHGMPIDTAPRDHLPATVDACRAVVAARLHAPERERALLRALRVRNFRGALIDDPQTIRDAAAEAGLDPAELERWTSGDDVEAALREDMDAARHPTPASLAQDARLADWEGGRRYTCPSYEMEGDDATLSAPGFQPLAVYVAALANLAPDAEQRPKPESAEEVLRWAGFPLASREVATIMGIDHDEARQQLARVADEDAVGSDGYWTLRS